MSLFYIDIRFPSIINEGHSVDTRFCTHDLIKKNDWNDHPCTQKNHNCITCINFFVAYHKNDLKVLTVTTVCLVSKSDYRIERYARSICIVSG